MVYKSRNIITNWNYSALYQLLKLHYFSNGEHYLTTNKILDSGNIPIKIQLNLNLVVKMWPK